MPDRCVVYGCNETAKPDNGIGLHKIPFFLVMIVRNALEDERDGLLCASQTGPLETNIVFEDLLSLFSKRGFFLNVHCSSLDKRITFSK